MIMGQTKLIHEHYDRAPLASIFAGIMLAGLAIIKLFGEGFDTVNVIVFTLTAIPMLVIIIVSIFRRNKPSIVVYNDRLEVLSDEIMYSDIKNIAMESGQLLIWLDESSAPMYQNLGANVRNAQQTYDILRSAYDKYNQEHNITPAQIENLPKRNKKLIMAITILIMIAILMMIFLLHR